MKLDTREEIVQCPHGCEKVGCNGSCIDEIGLIGATAHKTLLSLVVDKNISSIAFNTLEILGKQNNFDRLTVLSSIDSMKSESKELLTQINFGCYSSSDLIQRGRKLKTFGEMIRNSEGLLVEDIVDFVSVEKLNEINLMIAGNFSEKDESEMTSGNVFELLERKKETLISLVSGSLKYIEKLSGKEIFMLGVALVNLGKDIQILENK